MEENKDKLVNNKDKESHAKLVAEKLKDEAVLHYLKSIKLFLKLIAGLLFAIFAFLVAFFSIWLIA